MDNQKELKILFKIIQDVSSLELEEVLKKIVTIVTKLTQADSCFVYVLERNSRELVLRASKNPHKTLLKTITMKMGEGITGWVAVQKKPVAISQNAYDDSRFKYFKSLPEDKYEAFLSIPIINKVGVVGVINVQHKKKHIYSKEKIQLLVSIGIIVGAAVENAMLVEESLELKDALETRKVLDKAKGIIMKNLKLSEDEAYKRLRSQSMNSGKSIRELSEAIILSEKLLR
jgi:uroporphyrinogen-III synthase